MLSARLGILVGLGESAQLSTGGLEELEDPQACSISQGISAVACARRDSWVSLRSDCTGMQ